MELHEMEPDKGSESIPLEEESPVVPGTDSRPPRRRWGRLLILLPALLVCAALVLVGLNWTSLRVALSPLGALERGADRVMDLPQPAQLGFLGAVEMEENSVNCSGVLELQADKDGLRVLARDCTVGTDTDSQTFSLYLSPREAAACAPALTEGQEGWYGVSLEEPILEQARGTGGDPDYGWYFGGEELAEFQEAADRAREALAGVRELTWGAEERQAATAFLESCHKSVEHVDGEYLLHFTQPGAQETEELCQALGVQEGLLSGQVELEFTLCQRGTLRAVELSGQGLELSLELGEYPERELTPRLEVDWGTGSLTLALTVEQGTAPEVPDYANAFSLLPRID